jgi:hypothetical protein
VDATMLRRATYIFHSALADSAGALTHCLHLS